MGKLFFLAPIIFLIMPSSYAEMIKFEHGNHTLSGRYLEPTNNQPVKAVLLFVHGDGATAYDADGYYELLWRPLRSKGYAVVSWDKPGVGGSTGNWLKQSMTDRQSEVLAAIRAVKNKFKVATENIGLIGFSQAGWVVPAIANNSKNVGFVIGIGFATNWIDQGHYFVKTRHSLLGDSNSEIEQAVHSYVRAIEFFKTSPTYEQFIEFENPPKMSLERFQFVLENFQSDALEDYKHIKVPSLFIWGRNDLNVDSKKEFSRWQDKKNKLVTTKLIHEASHAMLNSNLFNTQNFGVKQWLKLIWYEERALAPEFIPNVILWLEQRKQYNTH